MRGGRNPQERNLCRGVHIFSVLFLLKAHVNQLSVQTNLAVFFVCVIKDAQKKPQKISIPLVFRPCFERLTVVQTEE